METEETAEILIEHLGYFGRIVGPSKSGYISANPDGKPVFNANIIVDGAKVWYGDIDLISDASTLQKAANAIGENLYILKEMDARFGTENNSFKELIEVAVATIKPQE